MFVTPLRSRLLVSLSLCAALAACGQPSPTLTAPAPTATVEAATAAPTASPEPPTVTPAPTATPAPLALTVNGQDITLSAYEHEVARCQSGLSSVGLDPAACPESVTQSLIEQTVIEQAAVASGLSVSEPEVEAALAEVVAGQGGSANLEAWLQTNGYSAEEFRAALAADLLRARLVAQVASQVGEAAEQVHARAILVLTPENAETVHAQALAGADFATLALTFSRDLTSRAAGGDLGWFPRGVLTVPEVEAAAFALEPGQTSEIIQSPMGYHIVQVIERDPARALSPAAAQTLRAAAFENWLAARLAEAQVTRHLGS